MLRNKSIEFLFSTPNVIEINTSEKEKNCDQGNENDYNNAFNFNFMVKFNA